MQGLVAELELGLAIAKCFDHRAMCDPAKCEYDSALRQGAQFVRKIGIAVIDLGADWFVIGRQTFNGIRNTAFRQYKIVIGSNRLPMGTEAKLMQHLIEKNAGVISGERSPRCIGAVHTGRETNNKKTRLFIAERWHGPAVIARKKFLNVVQKFNESGAIATLKIENVRIQVSAVRVIHMTNNRLAKTASTK